jgi:hypothetical protein
MNKKNATNEMNRMLLIGGLGWLEMLEYIGTIFESNIIITLLMIASKRITLELELIAKDLILN